MLAALNAQLMHYNASAQFSDGFQAAPLEDAHALDLVSCALPPLAPYSALRALCLSQCALGAAGLPEEVYGLPDLQVLRAAACGLPSVSGSGLARLRKLVILDVDDNLLTALPQELAQCAHLRALRASRNRLVALPPELLAHFQGLHARGAAVEVRVAGNPGLPQPALAGLPPPEAEPPADPPAAVRASCAWVASQAADVTISAPALLAFAAELTAHTFPPPPPFDEWHYCDDAAGEGTGTAAYCLALDALNFCFWPSAAPLEYDALALGLRARLRADARALSAEALAGVTEAEVTGAGWVAPPLPNAPARVASLRELGRGLAREFGGSALALVQRAGGSACELVRLLLAHFPCFNDVASYTSSRTGETRRVHFYKRAQIACGDLWAAFGMPSPGSARAGSAASAAAFSDIHALTAFADYRLPQLLRDKGVLVYSAALAGAVDSRAELPSGGAWEVEIRACTIEVVERMRACHSGLGGLNSVQLDWRLWNAGEVLQSRGLLSPHHRTQSTFY
jgi:hypothetical protein